MLVQLVCCSINLVLCPAPFFRFRPDLIIYHPESDDQIAAYLLNTANEEQDMESDKEPAGCDP